MLAKRIIPCLDVSQGRVVKGTNFVNLRDAGDPVELAKRYDLEGADELVFLDITASSDKRAILKDLVERTAKELFIPFTVGGGINDLETIQEVLNAGADKVSINTAAVKDPDLIRRASTRYGNQCIVVALDARALQDAEASPVYPIESVRLDADSRWEVFTHGGRNRTGIDAVKWAVYMNTMGAGELLVTSMDRDGTKAGYDLPLTQAIAEAVGIPVIASGGAGTLSHISEALKICDAALLASMLHFREVTVSEIKTECQSQNLVMRPQTC
ncbi:MAG: imidazole glycerol phosphate synthase subunit HisF [Candidatus Margulisiibacteriota bacterium]